MMKGLTLWQPWASLVGRGKHHETRSWATNYRGQIAIHAALRKPVINNLPQQTQKLITEALGNNWLSEVPLGAIIAVANLTDCKPVKNINTDQIDRLLGDYSHGRWAWKLSNIVILDEHLPFKGRQGLWNIPEEVESQLMRKSYLISI